MRIDAFLSDLENLCAAQGVSGFEAAVADVIRHCFSRRGIQTRSDKIGNLIAHLPGKGPRVLLVAHLDETGYLVRKILPDGFLQLERVGGAAWNVLAGQHVQIWTDSGLIPGVVGAVARGGSGDDETLGCLEGFEILDCDSPRALHVNRHGCTPYFLIGLRCFSDEKWREQGCRVMLREGVLAIGPNFSQIHRRHDRDSGRSCLSYAV